MAKPSGIRIDIETRSGTDIKTGAYRYSEDPDFKVLIVAVSLLVREGDSMKMSAPFILRDDRTYATFQRWLLDPEIEKHAYNANFERVALSRWLGMPTGTYIDPKNWRCTAVRANANGVFGSLGDVAKALRSSDGKDAAGKALIKFFSIPMSARDQKAANASCKCDVFHSPDAHPEKFKQFEDYCAQDVKAEAGIASLLPEPPKMVQREYEMDQRINDNGILHHRAIAEQAVAQVEAEKDRLMTKLSRLTGVENPNSNMQMQTWLARQGYPMASLAKDRREEALEDPDCPPKVRLALTMKGAASLSSVSKHVAALKSRGEDGRIRGSLQFYGAHTGREAGRGIQPQNLPRYEAPEADIKRLLKGKAGKDAPEIAKGSVRASLIPAKGHVFVVADYNAIEARVLGWLAGEAWVLDEFRHGPGKIYEATAAKMFGVNKDRLIAALGSCGKCGTCADCRLRGSGKVACIAEGELVLTDQGLVPIESVSRNHRVWDGVEWVRHEGVVCLGMKEVITYDGLTATPDHRVWCSSGDGTHAAFGDAAARGERLVQSGSGRNAVSVGGRYIDRAEVYQTEAPRGVRHGAVRRMLPRVLVRLDEYQERNRWLRLVRGGCSSAPGLAGSQTDCGEATLHQSERPGVPELRRAWDRVQIPVGIRGGALVPANLPGVGSGVADRQGGQRRPLRAGELETRRVAREHSEPPLHESERVRPSVLALRRIHREALAVVWAVARRDHRPGEASGNGEAQGVAENRNTARVYDLLNAGPRHRYTVSGRLVHNCLALGYAGGAGALVTMGAEREGIDIGNYNLLHREWETCGAPGKFHEWERDRHDYPELLRLRDLYRDGSPETARFWKLCAAAWDAAALRGKPVSFGNKGLTTIMRDGRHNRMVLPSGRSIWYRFARSVEDENGRVDRRTFIGKGTGVGHTRVDTHGGKLTENVTQAVARDVLFDLMRRIEKRTSNEWAGKARMVLHVHDEVVLEVREKHADKVLAEVLTMMSKPPKWAKGLPLRGEGAIMTKYGK